MDNAILYAMKMLNIRPKTYDEHGWWALQRQLREWVDFDPSDGTLPRSSKDMDTAAKKYVEDLRRDELRFAINADTYYAQHGDEKREKMFQSWIRGIEMLNFPAYVLHFSETMISALKERYMFTLNDAGKLLAYYRPSMDVNVWHEVGDPEKPFTGVYGPVRDDIERLVLINYMERNVLVYVDNNIYGPFPYYKLLVKYKKTFLESIGGTPDNVQQLKAEFEDYIKKLKADSKGDFRKCELQRGLQRLDKEMENMDEKMPYMKFLYRENVELPMLTNDPEEAAFAYFDLDSIAEGPTPDFDGFLEAVEPACREALMAAIYATFFAKSHPNQYIWIHGEGGDGKSSLLNAMRTYAGDNLACSLGQTITSDFVLENAVGKRMVILSDVKTGLSVKMQLIHNLTGHDPVAINRKNRPIITARLDPVLWIAANSAPDVNFANRNEARRCLYIKMCEPPDWVKKKFYFVDAEGNLVKDANGNYENNGYPLEANLVKEMPHILYKCREVFSRICPPPYSVIRQSLPQSIISMDNCMDLEANEMATYISETFDFGDPESMMKVTDIHSELQETRNTHGDRTALTNFLKRDIIRILCTAYGCCKKTLQGVRYLRGIRLKCNC